jgi:hypothetical protein
MLTLIKGQKDFETLINSTEWESGYIKETHFAAFHFQRLEPAGSWSNIWGEASLLRLLLALPEDDHALEIVSFNTENISLWRMHDLEEEKSATIQRRVTEADVGAFSLKCACIAYQRLERAVVGFGQHYSTDTLFNRDGDPLDPYNIDWRVALDEAFQIR